MAGSLTFLVVARGTKIRLKNVPNSVARKSHPTMEKNGRTIFNDLLQPLTGNCSKMKNPF
jgi:hypothetical protein